MSSDYGESAVPIIRGCVAAAMALALGAWAERARADEAFVCEDGRVINVQRGELELMKRREPCVAKYFDVATAPAPAVSTTLPLVASPVAKAVAPASDYRNVRIINASPGGAVWFRPGRQ